jgi:hypothetical protein
MIQLNPSIECYVTSKDDRWGRCLAWADYSPDHDTLWLGAFYDTGECWWVPQNEIRVFKNWSLGRPVSQDKPQ